MKLPDSLENMIESVVESTEITPEEIKRRQTYLDLTEYDVGLLSSLHEPLSQAHDHLMNVFYKHLLDFPETRAFLDDADTVDRLKTNQWRYLAALTEGKYDWEYVRDRLRVGIVHQQIGLKPKWYIGAYSNYLCTVIAQIHSCMNMKADQLADVIKALLKIVFLDIDLVLDTYFCADKNEMARLKDFAEGIVCNVPAGLVVLDKNLLVLSSNRFVEQFSHIPHNDLKGRDIESVLPGMGLHHRLIEVMSRNIPQQGIVFRRPDDEGGMEHFEISISPMRDTMNNKKLHNLASVMVVIEDLSEQERLRLQTHEADMHVRVIMDNVTEGIITIDTNGLVESYNRAAEHLFGYSASEILGNNVKMLMPEPYRSKHDGYLERYYVSNERHCLGMGYREVEGLRKERWKCVCNGIVYQ